MHGRTEQNCTVPSRSVLNVQKSVFDARFLQYRRVQHKVNTRRNRIACEEGDRTAERVEPLPFIAQVVSGCNAFFASSGTRHDSVSIWWLLLLRVVL